MNHDTKWKLTKQGHISKVINYFYCILSGHPKNQVLSSCKIDSDHLLQVPSTSHHHFHNQHSVFLKLQSPPRRSLGGELENIPEIRQNYLKHILQSSPTWFDMTFQFRRIESSKTSQPCLKYSFQPQNAHCIRHSWQITFCSTQFWISWEHFYKTLWFDSTQLGIIFFRKHS